MKKSSLPRSLPTASRRAERGGNEAWSMSSKSRETAARGDKAQTSTEVKKSVDFLPKLSPSPLSPLTLYSLYSHG
jgi:hypothetical protein